MQVLKQAGGGLIVAIVSIILVIGGISLALAESAPPEQPTATAFASLTLQSIFPSDTLAPTVTLFIASTETSTATLAAPATSAPPFACLPPNGWIPIIVAAGDTIYTLSQRYKVSEDTLKNGNCLSSYEVQAGNILYAPLIAATAPPIVCGPPAAWVKAYAVQPGDNLFRISLAYRISVAQLQSANCMGTSTLIYTNQRLWVPNVPTSTPLPDATLIFPSSTASFTPITPAFTFPPHASATSAATNAPPVTTTDSPAPTIVNNPTITLVPQFTPSITPFPLLTPPKQ